MDMFVYLTTNLANGKKYIGQHRGSADDGYLGSGTLLSKAVKKYGRDNFKREIICFCNDQQELDEKEKFYIELYDAVNRSDFYNIAEGGGGNPIAGISEQKEIERRRKISEATKGDKNPFYGHTWGGREKSPRYGKKHSEAAKEKMRLAKLGKKLPEEQKSKIRNNNPNAVHVDMYSLDGEKLDTFFCLRDVMRFLQMKATSTVRLREHIASGKPYHGYIFKHSGIQDTCND